VAETDSPPRQTMRKVGIIATAILILFRGLSAPVHSLSIGDLLSKALASNF
jgi:hypothetical protein